MQKNWRTYSNERLLLGMTMLYYRPSLGEVYGSLKYELDRVEQTVGVGLRGQLLQAIEVGLISLVSLVSAEPDPHLVRPPLGFDQF